jgi:hypothetical protein
MLDDLLIHKHHRDSLFKFITTLETLTIDIINNLIEEVNIHDEEPDVFKDFFNVTLSKPNFEVYLHPSDGSEKRILVDIHSGYTDWDDDEIGENVNVGGRHIGQYMGKTEDDKYKIKLSASYYIKQFETLQGFKEHDIIIISFVEKGIMMHENFRTIGF